jgi:prepilin-type N-terminal cleavage/methylation domain-containing protein
MIRRRSGFTIIELLIVMIVLGLLAGIAVLKYIDLRHRALAASVVGDLHAVRIAAYGARYENDSWPAEAGPGNVPPGLAPYLPTSFSFVKPEYTLDWENFVPPGGGPAMPYQVGVVVSAVQPKLQHSLEQILGTKGPFISQGGTLTFIIAGPDGIN